MVKKERRRSRVAVDEDGWMAEDNNDVVVVPAHVNQAVKLTVSFRMPVTHRIRIGCSILSYYY